MVVAPAYVLHCKLEPLLPFFSFGVAEYVLQGGLILLLRPFVGRFKKKFLLSFGTAVFYGVVLDFWRMLFGTEVPNELWQRAFFCGLGGCITAFAIALLLRTYLPQQGYELVVKELSDRYGWAMGRVKWIYDMSSLVVAILLMLLLFGEFSFSMIGAGTLLLTLVNTPLITGFGKLLDRFFVFTPFFPRFHGFFQKHFD
jgi:uncharacterized membrane protein YczE